MEGWRLDGKEALQSLAAYGKFKYIFLYNVLLTLYLAEHICCPPNVPLPLSVPSAAVPNRIFNPLRHTSLNIRPGIFFMSTWALCVTVTLGNALLRFPRVSVAFLS